MPSTESETSKLARSAAWAAYGDSLGFITELVDVPQLRRRIGREQVEGLMTFTRRVGGRFGVNVDMPFGAYSDDTQLRLATSRAIDGRGDFDIETFSKVELPVWTSYALGAGRATRAAASNLSVKTIAWNTNFYSSRGAEFTAAGGNGGAMRIQPHVWATRHRRGWVVDLVRNVLCTHGHMRALAGAYIHAACLADTLASGSIPSASELSDVVGEVKTLEETIHSDPMLGSAWVSRWEMASGRSLNEALSGVYEECLNDLKRMSNIDSTSSLARRYRDLVDAIGGFENSSRGSATKTALLATWLAQTAAESPKEALLLSANCLGSDTDTIGTMAGALIGCVADHEPAETVMDLSYITWEAERLARLRRGETAQTFSYPDLLHWNPPKAQLDVVGHWNGQLVVAGLDEVRAEQSDLFVGGDGKSAWQWLKLALGMTLLVKRRIEPRPLRPEQVPGRIRPTDREPTKDVDLAAQQTSLFGSSEDAPSSQVSASLQRMTAESAVMAAEIEGYHPTVVGRLLLALLENDEDEAIRFCRQVARALPTNQQPSDESAN